MRSALLRMPICLLLLAPACKKAPEPGNPQALTPTPTRMGIHEVGSTFAAATCQTQRRCQGGGSAAAAQGACEQALKPRFDAYARRLETSHLRGRIAYDGEKLKQCLAHIANETCADAAARLSAGPAPGSDCDTWIVPHVGLGGMCSDDHECMSGYCNGRAAAPKGGLSDGTCAPLPDVGQPCTDTCARGATCDASSDAPKCVAAPTDVAAR